MVFWTKAILARISAGSSSGSYSTVLAATAAAAGAASVATSTTSNSSNTTTSCERRGRYLNRNENNIQKTDKKVNLKSRMTSVGRFSLVSETNQNPSVAVFFMTLNGSLDKNEFIQLWKKKNMETKYERFHLKLLQEENQFDSFFPDGGDEEDTEIGMDQYIITESLYPQKQIFHDDLKHRIQSFMTQPMNLYESLWQLQISSTYSSFPKSSPYDKVLVQQQRQVEEEESSSSSKRDDEKKVTTSSSSSFPSMSVSTLSSSAASKTLLLFRAHHILADGVSLGKAIADLSDEAEELQEQFKVQYEKYTQQQKKKFKTWYQRLQKLLSFAIGSLNAFLYQLYIQCSSLLGYNQSMYTLASILQEKFRNQQTMKHILTEDGEVVVSTDVVKNTTKDEQKPQRVVSWCCGASVDQVKWVAKTLSNYKKRKQEEKEGIESKNTSSSSITINDIFVACITSVIAKQLENHQKRQQAENYQDNNNKKHLNTLVSKFNIVIPVHINGGVLLPGQSLGNRIGAMVARVDGQKMSKEEMEEKESPLIQRLYNVHDTLSYLKTKTTTPLLSYYIVKFISKAHELLRLPNSHMSYLFEKSHCDAIATISNVVGSPKALHFNGNKVESIFGFVPLPPGIPIGVVVSSYNGKMCLTLNAEPWIMNTSNNSGGDEFLKMVLEEYQTLYNEAKKIKNETEL